MFKTNLTVGEVLNALKTSQPGPVCVCVHGIERRYDTFGVFTLGGGLFVHILYDDDAENDRQSIEEAISMLKAQPPETKILLGVGSDLSKYLEIDQTTKVDLNLDITLIDYNVTLYDEKRGLDFNLGKPNPKTGKVLIEQIDNGFIYFNALFT